MSEPEGDNTGAVVRRFGRAAAAYAESPGHAGGADLERLVALLAPHSGMAVLDLATGAGHTAAAVAPHARTVLAVDVAPEMLERTRALARERGLANLRAGRMDAHALPLPDACFDGVTCRIAPHHFHALGRAVAEIARVLRPGGRFALEDSCAPADPELDRFVNAVERLRDPTHVRAHSEREWRAMLENAGLRVLASEIHRKTHAIEPWMERSGLDEAGRERVREAFRAAPEAARAHFALELEDGRPVRFTDDKLLLVAEKSL